MSQGLRTYFTSLLHADDYKDDDPICVSAGDIRRELRSDALDVPFAEFLIRHYSGDPEAGIDHEEGHLIDDLAIALLRTFALEWRRAFNPRDPEHAAFLRGDLHDTLKRLLGRMNDLPEGMKGTNR